MLKSVVKATLLILLTCGILYLMSASGLLNLRAVGEVFHTHPSLIAQMMLIDFCLGLFLLLRYRLLVHAFGVHTTIGHVAAATFVSNAVGQWAPGSLAASEVIRVGLMIGAHKKMDSDGNIPGTSKERPSEQTISTRGLKTRIALASIFDRLVGFFSMLLIGSVSALVFCYLGIGGQGTQKQLLLLSLFLGLGAFCIGILPFLARSPAIFKFMQHLREVLERTGLGKKFGFLGRVLHKVLDKIIHLAMLIFEACQFGKQSFKLFSLTILYSVGCSVMSCLALHLASEALGSPISFLPLFATFPVTSLATLLPIGFAGMGGPQLVTIAVLQAFAIPSNIVGSATFLHNAILLVVQTILGLLFAQMSAHQIKAILTTKKSL